MANATDSTLATLPTHPVADIFPLMSEEEVADLAADIAKYGQREPVWLHRDGRIIDGRNRWRACEKVGVEPKTRTYEADDEGLISFVISLNLKRRHLSESQRAMVAARVATMQQGARTDLRPIGQKSQGEAAEELNVSERSVRRARIVQEKGAPELIAAVDSGDISVSMAATIARETEIEQRALVDAVKSVDSEDLISLAARQKVKKQRKADGQAVIQSGWNEWHTPHQYIDAARKVLGGIDLDPASSEEANETVGAEHYFGHSGLERDWFGRVWLNPPYGGEAERFVTRLVTAYENSVITAGITLVNAHSTDTRWFQPLWNHTLCFTDHRIDFIPSSRRTTHVVVGSTHGSVFAYLGPEPEVFAENFSQFGAVVRRFS